MKRKPNEPHAIIEERFIFVANGSKTQTVNICSEKNQWGLYETTIRIPEGSPRFDKGKLAEIKSLAELESILRNQHNGKIENFRTWSEEWKAARTQPDIAKVLELWKGRSAKDWQRTDWSGPIAEYRHKHASHDRSRGEKEIESVLFQQPITIQYPARNLSIPFNPICHQLPLANQRAGQVIADALAIVEHPKGIHRPVMVEVKTTANNCWYALIECLQQVRMGRAYPEVGDFLEDKNLVGGVWGLIVAPSCFFKKSPSEMKLCGELLAALKQQTNARVAFASSDRLIDHSVLELQPEQNLF